MRILLTNHHMDQRAGSELLVTELAEGLSDRGHEVAVFTLFQGEFGRQWAEHSGIEVFSLESGEQVAHFDPDVLHVTHWPTLLHLRALGIDVPSVQAFLGVIPPFENPPPVVAGLPPITWTVSEEVAANVAAVSGWPSADGIHVIRNSITPGFAAEMAPASEAAHRGLRSLVVISNHFPADQRDRLGRICGDMGIELELIGLPDRSMEITPEVLTSHDAVVSLGRTAITAASLGIPTLVLDANGADGWLTPANLARSQQHNYSGRGLGLEADDALVRTWLETPPESEDLRAVAERIRRDHDFDTGLGRIEELLAQAVDEGSRPVFGRHLGVVTAYLGTINHQETLLRIAAAEQAATEAEVGRVTLERDDALLHYASALAARDEAVRTVEEIRATSSWRITAPLRRMSEILRRTLGRPRP